MFTTEQIKSIKKEANNNFNYRKKTGRQIVIASTLTNKKRVMFTSKPLKKLEIINELLEKTNKKQHVNTRRQPISERPSKI